MTLGHLGLGSNVQSSNLIIKWLSSWSSNLMIGPLSLGLNDRRPFESNATYWSPLIQFPALLPASDLPLQTLKWPNSSTASKWDKVKTVLSHRTPSAIPWPLRPSCCRLSSLLSADTCEVPRNRWADLARDTLRQISQGRFNIRDIFSKAKGKTEESEVPTID